MYFKFRQILPKLDIFYGTQNIYKGKDQNTINEMKIRI